MKTIRTISAVLLTSLVASSVSASIMGRNSLAIDFTNSVDAQAKATWARPDVLRVTTDGLGWDGESTALIDGWIQTIPLALGLSWRPTHSLSVYVSIDPRPEEIVLRNGQKTTPYPGDVYVRYSPDAKHWSTWQVLQHERQTNTEQPKACRIFSGQVAVPDIERQEYVKLIFEYSKLDVPWKSDEDAAVRWIVKKEPDFFAKQLPFIGYIEFRYEGAFNAGQRVKSFNADVGYCISGIHSAPKDSNAYQKRGSTPWSFKADETERKAEPAKDNAHRDIRPPRDDK